MFREYLTIHGIDYDKIFSQIRQIVVKSIISVQISNANGIHAYVDNPKSCYELFGFDILLDKNLKAWLMEVNISPSLKTSCKVDQKVKSNLIVDIFNLVGYTMNDASAYRRAKYNIKKTATSTLSPEERKKHRDVLLGKEIDCLENLTVDDARILRDTEDEYNRKGSFLRVYPDSDALNYKNLFQLQPYYDRLVTQWVVKYPLEKRIKILKGIPIINLRKMSTDGLRKNSESIRNSNSARNSDSTRNSNSTRNSSSTIRGSITSSRRKGFF